jgi:hypothetical protein
MFRFAARITCLLVLPVVLTGCGGDTSTNSASNTPDPVKAKEAAAQLPGPTGPTGKPAGVP